MSRSARLATAVAWLALVLAVTSAQAQDGAEAPARSSSPLAIARRALADSDFVAADHALDEAGAGALDLEALREWLELRALVAYAGERLGALEEALAGLAALLPGDAEAPVSFPPPMRARLLELVRTGDAAVVIAGHVSIVPRGGARVVGVSAETNRDRGHLVRTLRVYASIDARALREIVPEASLVVRGDPSRDIVVRYRIEAIGPGGAVIATLGSEAQPLAETVPGVPPDTTSLVVGLTTAGVALAVAGVVLGFVGVATDGFRLDGRTTVHGPTVVAPLLRF